MEVPTFQQISLDIQNNLKQRINSQTTYFSLWDKELSNAINWHFSHFTFFSSRLLKSCLQHRVWVENTDKSAVEIWTQITFDPGKSANIQRLLSATRIYVYYLQWELVEQSQCIEYNMIIELPMFMKSRWYKGPISASIQLMT